MYCFCEHIADNNFIDSLSDVSGFVGCIDSVCAMESNIWATDSERAFIHTYTDYGKCDEMEYMLMLTLHAQSLLLLGRIGARTFV